MLCADENFFPWIDICAIQINKYYYYYYYYYYYIIIIIIVDLVRTLHSSFGVNMIQTTKCSQEDKVWLIVVEF